MRMSFSRTVSVIFVSIILAIGGFFGGYMLYDLSAKQQYTTYDEEIAELQHQISTLNNDIEDLIDDKNALLARVQSLTTEKNALAISVQLLTTERDGLLSDIEELEAVIEEQQQLLQQKQTVIDDLNNQIEALRESLNDNEEQVERLEQERLLLLQEVALLENQVLGLQEDVEELESRVIGLQQEISDKESVINDLNDQIEELEGQITNLNSTISELQAEVTRLTALVQQLQDRINELEDEIREYETSSEVLSLYTLNGDTIVGLSELGLEKYNEDELTELILPNSYSLNKQDEVIEGEDYELTKIGNNAFANYTKIKSITIPEQIVNIAHGAFNGCSGLEEVYFNAIDCNSASSVGFLSGAGSESGITLHIGKDVTAIPAKAFNTCAGINKLIFDRNSNCEEIGANAFSYCTSLKDINLPSSIKRIHERAFEYCETVDTITIPEGVLSISSYAFNNCDDVVNIYYNAINCADIESVSLFSGSSVNGVNLFVGKNVEKIPNQIFANSEIARVYFEGQKIWSIGNFAFKNCAQLETIIIPETITYLGREIFTNCTNLSMVYYNAIKCGDLNNNAYPFQYISKNVEESVLVIGNSVTIIPQYLFCRASFTQVVFEPNSMCKDIGNYAFNYSEIENINLPKSLITIGKGSFGSCYSLRSITIPQNVNKIENNAFDSCYMVTELNYNAVNCADFDASNQIFTELGRRSSGVTVNIGKSVLSIPANFFRPTQSLYQEPYMTKIQFENGSVCQTIGNYAFNHSKITTITIPKSVNNIGQNAFYKCKKLVQVRDLTSERLFEKTYYSKNLYQEILYDTFNQFTIGELVVDNDFIYYKINATKDIYLIDYEGDNTDIIIPECVTHLYTEAFVYSQTTSITFNNNITEVSEDAFNYCEYLVEVNFTDNITSIGRSSFRSCYSLNDITLPNNLVRLQEAAFSGCRNITEVSLPDSVEFIGYNCFSSCTKLDKVSFGSNITNIRQYAFHNTSLTSDDSNYDDGVLYLFSRDGTVKYLIAANENTPNEVYVDNDCSFIAEYAFQYSKNITKIIVSDSVKIINQGAFSFCSSLESLTIGKGAQKIDSQILDFNESLKQVIFNAVNCGDFTSYGMIRNDDLDARIDIVIGAEVQRIPNYLLSYGINLYNNLVLKSVTFEEGSVCQTIGDYAFAETIGFTQIAIPDSVTSIGRYAFLQCSDLSSITISSSVTSIGQSAFAGCSGLENVYYLGESTQWATLNDNIGYDNTVLTNANRYHIYIDSGNNVVVTDKNGVAVNTSEYSVNYSESTSELRVAKVTFINNNYEVIVTKEL